MPYASGMGRATHHRQPISGPPNGAREQSLAKPPLIPVRRARRSPLRAKPAKAQAWAERIGMAPKIDSSIPEAFTFDDVLLKPGLSDVLPSEVDIRTRITREISLNIPIVASAMDTVTEYQHGHRHGAGRRHRRHPSQLRAGRAGGAGAQGEEVRIRHGGESAHHPSRRDARRRARADEAAQHFRHSRGGGRRQRQGRQAGRHPDQSRRALRHRHAPARRRTDDQGQADHRARRASARRRPSGCCISIASRSFWWSTTTIAASG